MVGDEGFEREFQNVKTFKYYFQCRRADILGVVGRAGVCVGCERRVSPLRGSRFVTSTDPVLTHWAKVCRASGAGGKCVTGGLRGFQGLSCSSGLQA